MMDSRLVKAAVSAVLVASLLVPATAMAARPSGKGGMGGKAGQGPMMGQGGGQPDKPTAEEKKALRGDRKLQALTTRIERILRLRKAKFDRAEAIIQRRIDRLDAIASRATSLGVDVTEATAALDKAEEELAIAATEEEAAVDLFKAVLTAENKKAAFAEARAQARVATKALQRARLQVVNALRLLHQAVDESAVWSPNASTTVTPEAPVETGETGDTTP